MSLLWNYNVTHVAEVGLQWAVNENIQRKERKHQGW